MAPHPLKGRSALGRWELHLMAPPDKSPPPAVPFACDLAWTRDAAHPPRPSLVGWLPALLASTEPQPHHSWGLPTVSPLQQDTGGHREQDLIPQTCAIERGIFPLHCLYDLKVYLILTVLRPD